MDQYYGWNDSNIVIVDLWHDSQYNLDTSHLKTLLSSNAVLLSIIFLVTESFCKPGFEKGLLTCIRKPYT